ncbi:SDR family NAD(P)-dependent oxidoreductase [Aeromicrobium sp.]|uniref:SDR family NAD(P)-dependent oxidoreductase n=1 Tax=Aeromicrobium sp. TaxID=1871063 RepID=UPI002FCACD3D
MTEGQRRYVAVVTGGSRGIGQATALRLAQDGCAVTVADVNPAGAEVAAQIVANGGHARFIETDVADSNSVASMVAETESAFGKVNVLAAVAAILGDEHSVVDLPLSEWQRVIDVNLTGVLNCSQAVLPSMIDQGWGRIVAVSSHARFGVPERLPYGVSKAGVLALIGAIAYGYARAGILANCVDPGRVLTDMIVPRYDSEYLANPPGVSIGRFAQPEEIAEVIGFLCSPRNTYAVGALWEASGGIEFA